GCFSYHTVMMCTAIRILLPDFLTLPSRTDPTSSSFPMSPTFLPVPLNVIAEVLEMTLSSLMFEMLEMSSSVKPSAKYSSLGSEDMLASGSTTIRRLSICTGGVGRALALGFLDFGPDSQALSPTLLSSLTV